MLFTLRSLKMIMAFFLITDKKTNNLLTNNGYCDTLCANERLMCNYT
jgi:hypothetical protein